MNTLLIIVGVLVLLIVGYKLRNKSKNKKNDIYPLF